MSVNLKSIIKRRSDLFIKISIAILAILIAALIGGIIIAFMGINPWKAYQQFFYGAVGNIYGFGETINKFTPLLCSALAFSLAAKSGYVNLGVEGQMGAGALFSLLIALKMTNINSVIAIIVSIIAGILGGILWGAIAGFLKLHFDANELLSTMMLNYIMFYLLSLLLSGPLKDTNSHMDQSLPIPESTQLPIVLRNSRLHIGIFIALAAFFAIFYLQDHTVIGFDMKILGANSKAASYAGINRKKSLLVVILLSSAIGGLAGSLELLGNQHKMVESLTSGYGFDGIGIAVMGHQRPLTLILSAILFAMLRTGTASMQRGVGVHMPILYILQAIVIITVITSQYFIDKINNNMAKKRLEI